MKLYVTFTSPYARLARILLIEKGLSACKSSRRRRAADSPYYAINPSGRVPAVLDRTRTRTCHLDAREISERASLQATLP
jgi:glutathione S-transferase